jgi:hypothetical protein
MADFRDVFTLLVHSVSNKKLMITKISAGTMLTILRTETRSARGHGKSLRRLLHLLSDTLFSTWLANRWIRKHLANSQNWKHTTQLAHDPRRSLRSGDLPLQELGATLTKLHQSRLFIYTVRQSSHHHHSPELLPEWSAFSSLVRTSLECLSKILSLFTFSEYNNNCQVKHTAF